MISWLRGLILPQTERLIANSNAMEVDEGTTAVASAAGEESIIAFQLEKICHTLALRLPGHAAHSEQSVCDAILTHLTALQSAQPQLLRSEPPRILNNLPKLTIKQKEKLRTVEDMLFKVVCFLH